MTNLAVHPHFSGGFIFRKVLGIELFYLTQLVFRGKQPYIPNFVEIQVGVVLHLGELRISLYKIKLGLAYRFIFKIYR